jgi:hypothetical protein
MFYPVRLQSDKTDPVEAEPDRSSAEQPLNSINSALFNFLSFRQGQFVKHQLIGMINHFKNYG